MRTYTRAVGTSRSSVNAGSAAVVTKRDRLAWLHVSQRGTCGSPQVRAVQPRRLMKQSWRLSLLLSLILIACGSTTGEHDQRCDARAFANTCTDFKDVPAGSSYANICAGVSLNGRTGDFADDASCDLANVAAGCQTLKADGTRAIVWTYKSTSVPDASAVRCVGGATLVTP